MRALPGAAELDWNRLREEALTAFERAIKRKAKA
jgi:hypothetical protein